MTTLPDQGVEQKQQKNAAVDQNRDDHGLRAQPDFIINGLVQQIHQRQFRRLAHGNAKKKAAQQGDERHIEIFPEEHPADVPLVHAQHIVKAEFLVALPDQEGIGIEQKQQGKGTDHDAAQPHHNNRPAAAPDGGHPRGIGHCVENVEDHDHDAAGEQIGEIQLLVFPDAVPGQSAIKCSHACSPPVAKVVSVSEIS